MNKNCKYVRKNIGVKWQMVKKKKKTVKRAEIKSFQGKPIKNA